MTLRPEYSLGHSEFNDFLFAIVGEEKNGMQLTVLSAMARLGLDPWGEADRLARLPKEAATGTLAATLADLPEGAWTVADARAIAIRLLSLLPRKGTYTVVPPSESADIPKPKRDVSKWLIWAAFAAAILIYFLRQHTG